MVMNKRGWLGFSCIAVLASLLLGLSFSVSQEKPAPVNKKEPVIERLQPRSPAEALKTFSVRDGFTMDLIASEPLLRDPVLARFQHPVVLRKSGRHQMMLLHPNVMSAGLQYAYLVRIHHR